MRYTRSRPEPNPLETPEVARKAVSALARAEAMGILREGPVLPLEPVAFRKAARRIGEAGVGRGVVASLGKIEGRDPEEIAALLAQLEQALEESPLPEREWPALEALFGLEELSRLVGASPSSVRRYRSGARTAPDDVAARLHFVAMVVADLAGSYNAVGVRRWFHRARSQLAGKAPVDLLSGEWKPEDRGPARVRELARALLASLAT
jgi:hypothetical protein